MLIDDEVTSLQKRRKTAVACLTLKQTFENHAKQRNAKNEAYMRKFQAYSDAVKNSENARRYG